MAKGFVGGKIYKIVSKQTINVYIGSTEKYYDINKAKHFGKKDITTHQIEKTRVCMKIKL